MSVMLLSGLITATSSRVWKQPKGKYLSNLFVVSAVVRFNLDIGDRIFACGDLSMSTVDITKDGLVWGFPTGIFSKPQNQETTRFIIPLWQL